MSEPLKRRNLLQAVSSPAPSLPDQAIAAVAARNGYPDISPTAPPASIADHSAHVGSVSPQAEITNSTAAAGNTGFIYAQANERNIPVAKSSRISAPPQDRSQIVRTVNNSNSIAAVHSVAAYAESLSSLKSTSRP